MPGMWIRRDPDTGQIWNDYSEDEMSALLRTCNPEAPEYLSRPPGSTRLFRVDHRTIGVQVVGRDTEDVPFYWEFDLYEGWAEQGRTEPATLGLTDPAHWAGLSVLDFIAASGATTSHARRMVRAEREHALRVATPLVAAFVELLNPEADGTDRLARDWYNARVEPLRVLLLEVLAKLTRGDTDRARELLAEVISTGNQLESVFHGLRERWNTEDYAARFPQAA